MAKNYGKEWNKLFQKKLITAVLDGKCNFGDT
jgi:hypothetical protein